MEIGEPHRAAVKRLCERLPLAEINWALTGSVAHRLQGAAVSCGDVDVQADADGAYAIAERLTADLVQPVSLRESQQMRSHFGRAVFPDLDGIEIEIMGAVQHKQHDDTWSDPTDPANHRRLVTIDDLRVPVLSLAYEADAYEAIGRIERATLLRRLI